MRSYPQPSIPVCILFLLLFGTSPEGFCQFQVHILEARSAHVVYDPFSDRIYASLTSEHGPEGNSIAIIDPHTVSIENTIDVSDDPTVIALSDDGQFLYTGFNTAAKILRIDVPTQTPGLLIDLGTHPVLGPYLAEDIKVMPANNTTIAVARKRGSHAGVVMFDNDEPRPVITSSWYKNNRIAFSDATEILGINTQSTERGVNRIRIMPDGLLNLYNHPGVLHHFSWNFVLHDHRLFISSGQVLQATTPLISPAPSMPGVRWSMIRPMIWSVLPVM